MNSAEGNVRAFAGKRRLRVRPCMSIFLDPGDPAVFAVSLKVRSRKYRLMASAARIVLTGKVDVPVFFSVGAPHPMLITTSPVISLGNAGPIVYSRPDLENKVRDWLKDEGHVEALRRLRLRPSESLHVARNETMLVSLPDRDIDEALERFIDLLDAFSAADRAAEAASAYLLPQEFRDLELIARHWALPDDQERDDAVRRAGPAVRAQLVAAIGPRLRDIDEFLDRLTPPLSEEARRLQSLGELGAELAAQEREKHEP